jgi:hypothetical protein
LEILERREHLTDLDIVMWEDISLLNGCSGSMWIGFIWQRIGTGHGDESSGSTKEGEFLN